MAEDLVLNCSVCKTPFLWTAFEQARATPPDRCPMCRRIAPAAGRQRGLVKWYSRAKGYGFITPPTGPELFFHKSGLTQADASVTAGQLVEFAVGRGPRGLQAEQVTVLA
jgi:CspA family cold shock protein